MADCPKPPKDLQALEHAGERVVIASFYGANRGARLADAQRRVFERFGWPINQVEVEFPRCTHGFAVDRFLTELGGDYDYFMLFDIDAVPLRSDFVNVAIDKIRDQRTVFGPAQQSNHIVVNDSVNHLYAGPSAFAISRKMYEALGRPTFDGTARSDCAEEITWRAEEQGYTVCLIFPAHVHERRWQLGNGHAFGIGTTYGDLVFHAFLPGNPTNERLFIEQCERLLAHPTADRLEPRLIA